MADAGADAIEVGIPFSDPVMDGPVIQQASSGRWPTERRPRGPASIELADVDVPLAVMTYYNLVYRFGRRRFARTAVETVCPRRSCPTSRWRSPRTGAGAADDAGVETVMLAAPTGSDERLARVCARSRVSSTAWGSWG